MKKLKLHKHTEQAKIIILSFVLAVIAWVAIVWVDNPVTTTTLSGIDVKFIGEKELRDRGLVIIGKKNIPEMYASVSGTRNDLMTYMDRVYMEADASYITEAGEYELPVTVSLPSSVLTLKKQKTENVPITIEKLSEKEIDIRVKQTGTLKNKAVKSEIADSKVTVSGAKSELDNLEYALATVDISKITDDCIIPTGYVLMGAGDNPITKNESIETKKATTEVVNTVYDLKTLPVTVELSEDLQQDYELTGTVSVMPESISAGVLEEYTEDDVKVIITSVDENGNFQFEFKESDGLYLPEDSKSIKIKANAEKKISKKIELNISAVNASSSYQTEHITVTAFGAESRLNSDNVKAYVDLNGLDAGTYSLPVKIEGDGVSTDTEYYATVTVE